MAVKSTGIYCLPSCKARFPKLENIQFFTTRDEAINAGFRGCKRCKSDEYPFTQPSWYKDVINYFHSNLANKIGIGDIETIAGVRYNTITRYFKQCHGVSPMKYFRKLKLEVAFTEVSTGTNYRDVALDFGYESVSGFRSAFSQEFGVCPGAVSNE